MRSEQGRWILSEAANGLSLAPSWEKDCCCFVLSQERGLRDGSENKKKWQENEKTEENKAGEVGERRGEGSEGRRRRRRGGSKGLGTGDASPCFHVSPLQEDCPSCAFLGMLWRGAATDPPCTGLLQPEWWLCLGWLQKKEKEARVGKGRQGSEEKGKVYVIHIA